MSALAPLSCGCRRIIQVDAAHWWWLRRDPPHMIVKRFGCTAVHNKALYKCFIHSMLHSFIKKARPFLSEHASQLLVQALVLSRLDYCTALLAGLPACSIKPLQLIQNATARYIFNEPKRMHITPLFINLHWLPIAARIKFNALMFAYKITTGSAPLYLNSLLQTYVPSRSLRSAKWTLLYCAIPKRHKITFTDF